MRKDEVELAAERGQGTDAYAYKFGRLKRVRLSGSNRSLRKIERQSKPISSIWRCT